MRGIVPGITRSRLKKTGCNAPADLWFFGKTAIEYLMDLVHFRSFIEWGIFDAN
jgi:hypothetical protein